MVISAILLSGCKKKDKDNPEVNDLVVIKRSTGVLYKVDKTNGSLTEIMTITFAGEPLTGLRGLVYDPVSGKCFSGATNAGNGNFYSIDLSTGAATLLNDNANGDWDAIADLVIAPDGNILSLIYSNIYGNSALAIFNKTTGNEGTHKDLTDGTDEIWSPGGLIYGSDNTKLIVGGETCVYLSNLNGVVSDTLNTIGTVNIDDSETYVMDMEKVDNDVFGLVYEYNDQVQYLVKVNTQTGALTEIKVMASGSNSNFYHCLALIPDSKLK